MDVMTLVDDVLAATRRARQPDAVEARRDLAAQLMFGRSYADALAAESAGRLDFFGVSGHAVLEQTQAHPDWPVETFKRAAMKALGRRHDRELAEAPQPRQRFRALSYLAVYPDIDAHQARTGALAWLDFSAIDFGALTRLYKTQLRHHTGDSLYSLDDYIDMGERASAHRGDIGDLDVFAPAVLKPTLRVQDEVVRVRDRWAGLHRLHPRSGSIPPPAFLGIVSEHANYEAWLEWERYVTSCLFETRNDPMATEFLGLPATPPKRQLTPAVRKGLEAIFGMPFEAEVGFIRLQHSRLPHWMGGGRGDAAPFSSWRDRATVAAG